MNSNIIREVFCTTGYPVRPFEQQYIFSFFCSNRKCHHVFVVFARMQTTYNGRKETIEWSHLLLLLHFYQPHWVGSVTTQTSHWPLESVSSSSFVRLPFLEPVVFVVGATRPPISLARPGTNTRQVFRTLLFFNFPFLSLRRCRSAVASLIYYCCVVVFALKTVFLFFGVHSPWVAIFVFFFMLLFSGTVPNCDTHEKGV
jgi:hypothetical protein